MTSVDTWSGVPGRILVRDVGVRADTLDFTAARFMARRDGAGGATSWLEAGWADLLAGGRHACQRWRRDRAVLRELEDPLHTWSAGDCL